VTAVIDAGEVIGDYPGDTPLPTQLLLGFAGKRPLHVVAAKDKATRTVLVVTVYEPDPTLWSADYRTRRAP